MPSHPSSSRIRELSAPQASAHVLPHLATMLTAFGWQSVINCGFNAVGGIPEGAAIGSG